jgi:beta-lactam-binding protein with PASTA domain
MVKRGHQGVLAVVAMVLFGAVLGSAHAAPWISRISPGSGSSLGGTSVNISGEGFFLNGTTRVTFDGVDATSVYVSTSGYGLNYIFCTTPAHAVGGVDVTVINPDGQSGTRTAGFTYTVAPPPTLGSVSPASGATAGGAPVTVNGTNFSAYGTTRVTFDGVDATEVHVSSPSAVTCRTPAHALGAVNVAVVNSDGQSGTLEDGFTYSAPQVTGVVPAAGSAEGGTPVTVSGACFAASGVRVLFGGAEAAAVTVSGGGISCILPPHAAGVVDVTVINPDDSAGTSPAAFTYRNPGEIVVRVDADNISGVEDGSAWATAFPTIQQGIDAVAASGQTGEVWVAEGTYTADTSGTVVATMASFCDLYGGFAGVETKRDESDVAAHASVIDGQNESACVYGADTARLDGFTITRGNGPFRLGNQSSWASLFASFVSSSPLGFAVDNSGVSPTIAHCTFTNNNAMAAVVNFAEEAAPSSPLFTGCTFSNNGSTMGNGALAGMVSKSRLDNCLFTGNGYCVQDIAYGGECSPTITRCAFRENEGGYAVAAWTGISAARLENCEFSQCTSEPVFFNGPVSGIILLTPIFSNCTFAGNTATREVIYARKTAKVELRNCIVWGNTGPLLGTSGLVTLTATHCDIQHGFAGTGNIAADPLFVDAASGDYRLQAGSPCIDTGTADGAPATDLVGMPRPQGAGFDMGTMEMPVSTVPVLVGKTPDTASSLITNAGLVVGRVTEQYSLTVPAGVVIYQWPPAGTLAPTGAAVDLLVSKGPQPVAVPDVVGQTQGAAAVTIANADLLVGDVAQQYSATVPAGTVLSQSPPAGNLVLPGTPVNLFVSRGVPPSVMPDLVGQPRAQAVSTVTGAGLVLGTVTENHSDNVPAGSVMAQSPAAGTELPPGATVSLMVSLGPAPIVEGEGEGESPNAETAKQELADVYDLADTNGDGTLSFGEASAAVPGLTQAVFSELDSNGDGQLSAAELGLEDGAGCAGCQGGKSAGTPADMGKRMGDLFLTGLGLLGLAAMVMLRHK